MAKKIRITRKTLKQDEVRSFWLRSWHWVHSNQKSLLIGAAVVAVLMLFASAYRGRVARRSAEANLLLTQAQIDQQEAIRRAGRRPAWDPRNRPVRINDPPCVYPVPGNFLDLRLEGQVAPLRPSEAFGKGTPTARMCSLVVNAERDEVTLPGPVENEIEKGE